MSEELTTTQVYYRNHRDERLQAAKDYAAANKEKKKLYYARYYQKHKEELKAKHKAYVEKNKAVIYEKYRTSYGPRNYAKKKGRPLVPKIESPPVQEQPQESAEKEPVPVPTFVRQEGNFLISFL